MSVIPCGVAETRLDTYDMPGGEPDDEIEYLRLRDSHGGDPSEWPERLRVREWPA